MQEKGGGGGIWGRGRKKEETRRVQDLTVESMADAEWQRWCLTEGLAGRAVAGTVLVREIAPQKVMVLDASFEAVGGSGLETWVYWRYNLTGGRDENRFSINALDMRGMLVRAFVMIMIRRERPARKGKTC